MDAGERDTTVEALAAELAQLRGDIDTRVQKEVTRQLDENAAAAGSTEGTLFTASNPLSRTSAVGGEPAASAPPAGAALQLPF